MYLDDLIPCLIVMLLLGLVFITIRNEQEKEMKIIEETKEFTIFNHCKEFDEVYYCYD